jgi:hypothetical protein
MSLPLARARPLSPPQVRIRSMVAAIGAAAAWACVALLAVANFVPAATDDAASPIAVAGTVAFFSAAPLWLVMILEFLREKPSSHPLIWGFLLLTGPVFGPLLFYYFVWRKRYAAYAVA